MENQRVFVYISDLMIWTGKSRRSCQKLMTLIRKEYEKESFQPITVAEYCQFMKVDPAHLPPLQ
ncbi:MAG: hypothetical protein K9I85_05125 [Saprospiraceae bacterium]|nr:hypothetical protein [Saprospiraceae bacterium]